MPDGFVRPFPDETWNRWDLKPDLATMHLFCLKAMFVDDTDSLWILDPAAPMLMSIIPNGPKLGNVDSKTNRSEDR
jgi:hypothetical protein